MGFDCKTINWILYMFFCSVNVHTILEKSGQLCGVLFVTMIIRLAAWFEEIFGIHRVWCINMGLVHNRGPLSQSHCVSSSFPYFLFPFYSISSVMELLFHMLVLDCRYQRISEFSWIFSYDKLFVNYWIIRYSSSSDN
jgi:hypothetical protein